MLVLNIMEEKSPAFFFFPTLKNHPYHFVILIAPRKSCRRSMPAKYTPDDPCPARGRKVPVPWGVEFFQP